MRERCIECWLQAQQLSHPALPKSPETQTLPKGLGFALIFLQELHASTDIHNGLKCLQARRNLTRFPLAFQFQKVAFHLSEGSISSLASS